MASVFKLGRDKKKKSAPWYFEYQDHLGKKRMRKGFTEKSLTEQLAVKLETEARLRRLGFIDEKQAALADEQKSHAQPLSTSDGGILQLAGEKASASGQSRSGN